MEQLAKVHANLLFIKEPYSKIGGRLQDGIEITSQHYEMIFFSDR